VNRSLFLIAASLLITACPADLGHYVWVDDYAQTTQAPAQGYVISPGDVIYVHVYNEEKISTRGRVRADGKLSLPLLNDVDVAGYTPNALAQQLQTRFKEFIRLPVVNVSLEEMKPLQVSLLGEVAKPGQYLLDPTNPGILQAVASAGGLTDFAHKDRIFVLRQGSPLTRIRFRYDALIKAESHAAQFRLQSGDTLVVE
jgi:polysaccharide export outer membrane protein